MDTQMEMEARLWEYIDGSATAAEMTTIELLVRDDAAWRLKYAELLDIHQLMTSSDLDEPSMRFTKNVMDELGRLHVSPAAQSYINRKIIFGIMSFFIALLLGFLVYGFGQMEWTANTAFELDVKLPEFDLSRFVSNTYVNAFMVVNIIIGLVLFDRYLSSKRPAKMRRMG